MFCRQAANLYCHSISIDQLDKRVHHLSQIHTYAVSPRVDFLVSLPDCLVGYTLSLYNTLAAEKPPASSTEPMHAPIPPELY